MSGCDHDVIVFGGGSAGVEIAQIVRRLGGEVALVEGAPRLIPREAAALGEALRKEGIELDLGVRATAARRDRDEYVLQFDNGKVLRGDRLLAATGRLPQVEGIGLETVGVTVDPKKGIAVDDHLRAGERGRARMQQATLAIRARIPVAVLNDTIQPFPSFSGMYSGAVQCLVMNIMDMPQPRTPMEAQMANMPRATG